MIEEWRDIEGYEGHYQVSNLGRIRNNKTRHILAQGKNTWGYSSVKLCRDGHPRTKATHKLVATAFLGKPPIDENGRNYDVNHKDRQRTNCTLDNLEYLTKSDNITHAHYYRQLEEQRKIRQWLGQPERE